jgi:hypothetical protein
MRLIPLRSIVMALMSLVTVAHAQDTAQSGETGVTVQSILSVVFPAGPHAPAFIALTRYTLPPGTGTTSGATTGPRLIWVEAGEVTIRSADADTGFRRAADAPAMTGGGGPDVVLGPGANYLPPDPAPFELRNDGARGAVFLDALVFPRAPFGLVAHTTMDAVVVDPLVDGVADAMPGAPVEVRLDRFDIAAGQRFDLIAAPGPRLFVVESGTLGLAAGMGGITYSAAAGNNPGSTAGRSRSVAPGGEALLTARGSVVVQAGASGSVSNLGRTRLVLLMLSVLPAGIAVP